jgi:hypothetical protein
MVFIHYPEMLIPQIDLIPIEEMHHAQAGKEQQRRAEDEVELNAKARWHGGEGRLVVQSCYLG